MIGFLTVAWLSVSLIKLVILFDTIDSIQEPITVFFFVWISFENQKRKKNREERNCFSFWVKCVHSFAFTFEIHVIWCGLSLWARWKQLRRNTRRMHRRWETIKRVINSNRFEADKLWTRRAPQYYECIQLSRQCTMHMNKRRISFRCAHSILCERYIDVHMLHWGL